MAPGDRPRASGQLQATAGAASIIGPLLAAPLLFTAGIGWATGVNAVSFAALRQVHPAQAAASAVTGRVLAGSSPRVCGSFWPAGR